MSYYVRWIPVARVLFALGFYTLPAGGSGCTGGFPTRQQLLSTTGTAPAPQIPLQGFFPALRITCDGHLMEIIYIHVASRGGSPDSEYFNVWRENVPGTNVHVYLLSSGISSRSKTLLSTVGENIGLYSVTVSNFSVRARDFIGFTAYQPSKLQFLNLDGAAPGSFYTRRFLETIDLNTVTKYDRDYFPLITVVIASHSVRTPPAAPTTVTFTVADTPGDSTKVTITGVYIVPSGVAALMAVSLTVLGVACVVSRVNKERRNLRQRSRREEVANSQGREISSKEGGGSSDGDNSSMEYNPNYGGRSVGGRIELDACTRDEDNYHTLELERKPAARGQEQQHAVNGDSNYYHILQHLDRKSNYDAENEYCDLTCGFPKLEGRSGCSDATPLEQATTKSGTLTADIEIGYDSLNAGDNHAKLCCTAMVVKPNTSYGVLTTISRNDRLAFT